MFKKDKRPADKTSTFYNGSSSPLVERKEKTPSPISSNFEETNKEVASSSSQSTTEPVSWDTLDPFSVFDVSANIATSAKSSTVTRQSKPVVSSSTLQPSALQASYKQGTQSASTAANQIQADKMEVTHIIANYAVEPLEMLHLGKL
ncbi:unnamed protein product [Rotaria sp. Silwood1]|nr:unnamed protein product [Rotaria sp. Silwood1]CAF1680680.1 unnamed protein product [Rotaria sp. Silwood1]